MPQADADIAAAARDAVLAEVGQHADGIGARTLIDLLEQRGSHDRRALQHAVQDALDESDLDLNSRLQLIIPKERPYGLFY